MNFSLVYDPIQSGSIIGSKNSIHDKGILRAIEYKNNMNLNKPETETEQEQETIKKNKFTLFVKHSKNISKGFI